MEWVNIRCFHTFISTNLAQKKRLKEYFPSMMVDCEEQQEILIRLLHKHFWKRWKPMLLWNAWQQKATHSWTVWLCVEFIQAFELNSCALCDPPETWLNRNPWKCSYLPRWLIARNNKKIWLVCCTSISGKDWSRYCEIDMHGDRKQHISGCLHGCNSRFPNSCHKSELNCSTLLVQSTWKTESRWY